MAINYELKERILNLILNFKGSFTLEELFEVLRKENILKYKNKEQIIDTIDYIFESSLIEHIPFSDRYVVVS